MAISQDTLRSIQLEEVFIQAVRASEVSPISQITANREQIQALDAGQDASVTLEKLSPSIVSFSDAGSGFGNYNQFRLRGIDQTRINITLNGVPLNDMVDQGVFFSNFVDFSSSIQSLQVQRGVGVSTNGTVSYAGSINYESINLSTSEPSGSVGLTSGSFRTLKINAEAGTGRLPNDFSAYARVSRITSDGYKYHSGSNAQSAFVSAGKFFENSVLKFTAFAGKTQNDQAYLPVLLTDIQADPRTNYFSRNDTDDFEQELIQVQYVKNVSDDVTWNSSVYYGGARGFFPFFDSFFNSQTLYILANDHYGLMSTVNIYNENFQLTGGIHGYLFDRENETAIAPSSTPFYKDRTDKDEFSAFAKAEFDLNDLTLFADLQFRNVSMKFTSGALQSLAGTSSSTRSESFFNPRIGATYQLSERNNIYASFGRTGREPTRTDLLQGDFNSAISAINVTAFTDANVIKSEFVNDIEIGFRHRSEKAELNVNGFFMDFENEISLVGGLAQNSYVALRQNVASSNRSGLEIDFAFKPSEQIRLGLQSTFMQTNVDAFDTGVEVLTDVEHVFAPSLILAPTFTWLPTETITFNLDARYVGESFMELGNNADFVIPSWFVANANIKWKATDNIEIGFWLNNLLDEEYFTDGAPVDFDFDGTPEGPGFRIQPPRNYFLTANFKF